MYFFNVVNVNVAAYHGIQCAFVCISVYRRCFFPVRILYSLPPSFVPLNQWVPGYHRGRPCLKLAKTLLPPLAVPLSSSKKTILTGPGRILTGGAGDEKLGAGLWRRCCP